MKKSSLNKSFLYILFIAVMVVTISSCRKEPAEAPVEVKSMDELVIPADFEFKTTREVTIHFQDRLKSGSTARYDVFLHNPVAIEDTVTFLDPEGNTVIDTVQVFDRSNDLIASKISETGLFDLIVSIPAHIQLLYVIKNEYGIFSSQVIEVNQNSAYFGNQFKSGLAEASDVLYGINIQSDLIQINPADGSITVIDDLPNGSEALAVDKRGGKLYFVGKNSPNALYSYNLATKQTMLVANLKIKTQGMEFNPNDGLLYMFYRENFYKVDASSGKVLFNQKIDNLDNKNGGDLSLGPDGNWYISTYSGLYRMVFRSEKIYAQEIEDDLPFNPTGLSFDSNGDIWISVKGNGRMVKMSLDGSWQYMFEPYVIGIDDLTSLPVEVPPVPDDDADDDGVINFYDHYPNDPQRAYDTYTPSLYGLGTATFEDLWPSKGDYDFNDLIVQYHFTTVMNANDKVVEVLAQLTVVNVGASFSNGFGLQLPVNPAQVASVTGYNLTENFISLDGKGLETGQDKAVVIAFDHARDNLNQTLNIKISFTEPLDAGVVGTPPYNPFIFIDGDRGREVHQINQPPTLKMNPAYFGTGDDISNPSLGIYYRTKTKLPWAMNILDVFGIPKETSPINRGYLKFNSWAESGGEQFPDWYKNKPGYLDASYLNAK